MSKFMTEEEVLAVVSFTVSYNIECLSANTRTVVTLLYSC